MPNILNILVFPRYNPVQHFKKSTFKVTLRRILYGPVLSQLRKEGLKELLNKPIFAVNVDERSYFLPNTSNILVFGTDNSV